MLIIAECLFFVRIFFLSQMQSNLAGNYLKCCRSGFTAKLQVTKRLGLILFPKMLYVFPHNSVMFVLNNKWALFLICCAMERFSLAHIRAGSIFTHFLRTFGCICFLQFSPGLYHWHTNTNGTTPVCHS